MRQVAALIVLSTVLLPACGQAGASNDEAVVAEHLLLSVRLDHALYDGMGNVIEYREWHDGSFKKTSEQAWQPVKLNGEDKTVRMWRYLIIPKAPWTGRVGRDTYIMAPDGTAERVGTDEGYVPLNVPGQDGYKLHMHRSTATAGTLIGEHGARILQRGPDDTAVQIGTLESRDIRLDSGVVAAKVLMTRGMGQDAVWEGEVGNVTYRENQPGQAIPVRVLEYRKVKLHDGRETFLLMSRPAKGAGTWAGVHEGKVYREK